MRNFVISLSIMLGVTGVALNAVAGEIVVPDGDIAKLLLDLAMNYKAMGLLGSLSIVTVLTVEVLKRFAPEDWKFKRLAVLAVSIVYGIVSGLMIPGSNIISVLMTVLLSSGGAMALYEALKGSGILKRDLPGTISGLR